jgi:NitT/TauT family transport system ATP-binding protein
MGQALIEARGISKRFYQARLNRSTTVLEKIFLSIRPREFVSIVGTSGCGKTTLLHIFAGLIEPTEGRILVNGKPGTNGRDSAIVFQNPALLPWRTVNKNISYGLECMKSDSREARIKAESLLSLVGLDGFGLHYPYELSRGMQQRVSLARALAVDPEILLMDEPFASLDAQTREEMQTELLTIWEKTRKTVIFVTHLVSEAVFLSDRIVVLSGRPASVNSIIDVQLSRPRDGSVRYSECFQKCEQQIRAALSNERAATTTWGEP